MELSYESMRQFSLLSNNHKDNPEFCSTLRFKVGSLVPRRNFRLGVKFCAYCLDSIWGDKLTNWNPEFKDVLKFV